MPYSPNTVANYFIKKYNQDGLLTPMKLIKLTYLAYSWYLTLTDGKQKLLDEEPEAWQYGPVFPSLYHSLKGYGKQVIKEPLPYIKDEAITEGDSQFLDKIWDMYGQYDGIALSAMTHTDDSPWRKAFNRGFNAKIADLSILEHYRPRLKF